MHIKSERAMSESEKGKHTFNILNNFNANLFEFLKSGNVGTAYKESFPYVAQNN